MDGGKTACLVHMVEYHTAVNKSWDLRNPRTWSPEKDQDRRSHSLRLHDRNVHSRRNQGLEVYLWARGGAGRENVAIACHAPGCTRR